MIKHKTVPEGIWLLYFSWILKCYWIERSRLRAFPGAVVLLGILLGEFSPLIVSAHLYCARKFNRNVMHRCTRWLIEQMDIATALPGFSSLELWVTPKCFFFLGSAFSLPIFYVKRTNKETLWIRNLNFFAKCLIESRYFYLCDGFKCLLKG